MEAIYLLFYFVESLRKYFGDSSIVLNNNIIFLSIVVLLSIILLLYISAFKQISAEKRDRDCLKIIFGFIILFSATCLFLWPIGSADVFTYINQTRVLSANSANPYITPYNAFPNDELYYFINTNWAENTSPYGPLFIFIGSALSFAGNNNLVLTLFIFKLFFILIHVFNCVILYNIFKDSRAVFLYGWNPLIVYEFAINGHNDVLIIFFLLLSLFFLLKQSNLGNFVLSWTFLLCSVLMKYTTVIFMPIFLLVLLANTQGNKKRMVFLFFAFLASAIMLMIFYLPLWQGWQTFSGVSSIYHSPNIMFSSIIILLFSAIFFCAKIPNFYYWGKALSQIAFIFSYYFILIKMLINFKTLTKNSAIKYSCLAMAVFLATFLNWLMPWYFTVLIALMICYFAAYDNYKKIDYAYGITLFGILYYVILR